ncbi:glycosyltransferase [Rhodoferax sp. TBRC 17198]|uniref:glycosyltransferase family 4 protein n=1 Tax=Rhodoferax potami TaxID=3068338 RepID=UPI0028BE3530|nr:glycosyltransferase [Rhodoferax sp. TBRC 17198]MDT7522968.1 glycosyltransferase [Rhodoferax sp. TBRC 17198]
MKILLSAFACAPNTGSEAGGGWVYACELAKKHQVWVLTDVSRKLLIEKFSDPLPSNLQFVYYRPSWLSTLSLNSKTAHLIYQAWQMGAWRIAKKLDEDHDFDVCWHLTYGVFRQPSWMWKVGKPFVFGPVGGGERAPMRLWKSMPIKEKLRELARDVVNQVAWILPGLRATYKQADLVIARTDDTRQILPAWALAKTKVQQEIGGYPARVDAAHRKPHAGALKVLFAGRLLGWKGVHLAINAFAQFLAEGGKGEFTIVGEGPTDPALRTQVNQLGLSSSVHFIGKLPQNELFRRYTEFDVLLFPSLHDSGGNVVIEALSFGLPVICLDLGGPSCFVDASCGAVVPAQQATESEVTVALSQALKNMLDDAAWHQQLSINALARANDLTWERQIERVMSLIEQATGKK